MLSKKLIVLTSVPLFLIGLMIVIILPVAKIERSPTRMIVFEACSQSTTLYIFDVNNKTSMGKESKFTVQPSISEYSGKDYKEIETYLKPLFDFIDQNVPKKEMKEIPVYFLAKEELGLKKNQEANKLVEYISRRLTMTDFVFEKDHLKIMEGSDEGLSLWLSTNYLYNTLQKNNNVPNKEKSQSPSFVGIHDVEVESTQIVFVPEQTQKGESTRSVHRNGETYKLYEHSYMGYGMNSSRDLFEKKLDKADENGNVLNPCLPKDFKRFSEVLQKDMIGTSDPALCSTLISSLFDKSCTKTSCGFNDIYQPPLNGKFISKGSNVESTAKFLGIKFNEATPKKMNDAAQTLCSLNLNDYTKKYNSDPENFCFQAFYLSSIWSRGFGFNENQNIEIVDRVDEHDVSLALGYSLLKLDSYPKQNYVQTVAGVGVYYLLSAMGGIFIILSAILFSFYFKRPSYSPSD